MFREIIIDFLLGMRDSLQIFYLVRFLSNEKYYKSFKKLIFNNIFIFLYNMIIYRIGVNEIIIVRIMTYIINTITLLLHSLYYIDIINSLASSLNRVESSRFHNISILDIISGNISLSLYMLLMYMTTDLLKYFLGDQLIITFINIIIMSIYHSFYSFNNYWNCKKIAYGNRIKMHELLWPYYIGYGFIISILYQFINHYYFVSIYYIYLTCLISIPFKLSVRYPTNQSYGKISLSLFSGFLSIIFNIINYFFKK